MMIQRYFQSHFWGSIVSDPQHLEATTSEAKAGSACLSVYVWSLEKHRAIADNLHITFAFIIQYSILKKSFYTFRNMSKFEDTSWMLQNRYIMPRFPHMSISVHMLFHSQVNSRMISSNLFNPYLCLTIAGKLQHPRVYHHLPQVTTGETI